MLGLATAGGAGRLPWAPGTWGSALAIPIFVLFSPAGGPLLALSWLALACLGVWAADGAEALFQQEDDRRIVIDEVVGQLLTLAPLLAAGAERSLPWLVTGFVAFRLFDVWKPGPVRWAERRFRGGMGVIMDDVAAGALGALTLAAALALRAAWGGEAA